MIISRLNFPKSGSGVLGIVHTFHFGRHHWAFEDPALAPGSEAEQLEGFRGGGEEIRRVFGPYDSESRDGFRH